MRTTLLDRRLLLAALAAVATPLAAASPAPAATTSPAPPAAGKLPPVRIILAGDSTMARKSGYGDAFCDVLLMSIPGVGAITATAYLTAVEDPANFSRSRSGT